MKKLIVLIFLLMTGQVWAYGTAKEDTSTAITFVHSIGMDSVRYYASQDTTSWEINRLMVRAFAPDSTNYALVDTFDNPGTYFVKIVYWEGGVDSSALKVLPDIRDVAAANEDVNVVEWVGTTPANVVNVGGQNLIEVNVQAFSENTTSADNLEEILNEDGVGADVEIDSTFNRTFVINNNSGTGTGLHIEGSGYGAWLKSTGSATAALYADGSGGTNSDGLRAEGTGSGSDFEATLNISDNIGTWGTADFDNSFLTDALIDEDLAFDSMHFRTVVINQTGGSGYGLYIASNQDNDAALLVTGTGTNTDGARFSGTDLDIEAPLFIDEFYNEDTTGHGTAQSFAVLWKDTTAYQGAAGALSAAGVWNYDISNFDDTTSNIRAGQYLFDVGLDGVSHTTPTLQMKIGGYSGAAGDDNNIKDDIAAISAPGGSGAFSCSLFAWDGSSAITSGSVRMISGVNEYVLPIDANGWVEFSLDGGTWTAYATALRFIQDTIPQTITFLTHHIDTISMIAFSPSTPTDTGKVNLYVWTDRILGDTLEGATLRVIPLDKGKNWVTGGNRIVLTGEVTVKTDSTGYAEIEVYQSSFVSPYPSGNDSLKMNISLTYPGLGSWHQFNFVAPDSGNQYQLGVRE